MLKDQISTGEIDNLWDSLLYTPKNLFLKIIGRETTIHDNSDGDNCSKDRNFKPHELSIKTIAQSF